MDKTYLRIDFLPNRLTLVHEDLIRDLVTKVFYTNHPYDWINIGLEAITNTNDQIDSIWRIYYTLNEDIRLDEKLPAIILPILKTSDETFKDLIKDEYYMELVYTDSTFEEIIYNQTNMHTIQFIGGLNQAQYEVKKVSYQAKLLNNKSKMIIGNMATYKTLNT